MQNKRPELSLEIKYGSFFKQDWCLDNGHQKNSRSAVSALHFFPEIFISALIPGETLLEVKHDWLLPSSPENLVSLWI